MKPIVFLFVLIFFLSFTKSTFAVPAGEPCQSTPGGSTCDPGLVCAGTTPGQPGNGICIGTNQTAKSATEEYLADPNKGTVRITTDAFARLIEAPEGIQTVAAISNQLYAYRPASVGEYIAYVKQNNLPGIKPAYAQTGFAVQAFSPVIKLWALARNIALIFFVVIFVIVGFMIMLRKRIDPRTVITVQQAIPKLIIGILLVLFSYAIVGSIIDLVNVGTRAIAVLLQNQGFIAQVDDTSQNTYSGEAADKSIRLTNLLNANVFGLFQQLYNVDYLVFAIGDLSEFNTVASVLRFDQLISGGGITRTVLWIAMFIAVIRTFFMLLTNYLIITLYVIFSPFQFLMMALPGQGDLVGWFRKLMSRVLVFPVTFFMLALAAIFMAKPGSITWYNNPGATNSGVGNIWRVGPDGQVFYDQGSQANYTDYWSPVGLGNWGDAVGPLLTLAIVLTVPRVADLVREVVDPKGRPSAAEGEAGQALQKAAGRIPMLGSFTRV